MFRARSAVSLALVALLFGGVYLSVKAQDNAEPTPKPAAPKSVAVFPIVIKPQSGLVADFPNRVAAGVGLVLEKEGIENVELGEPGFDSPETDAAARIAADFAEHVRKNAIATEYAIYAEIHGTPKTGPKQIITIVVDRSGKVVLAGRDDEETYKQTTDVVPKDPMTCVLFIARRFQNLWQPTEPRGADAPEGKMARYWREQSDLPERSELEAIQRRGKAMAQRIESIQCGVYPIGIGDETDAQCAAELAEALDGLDICRVVPLKDGPQLHIPGDPNEQKVLWDTARAVQKFVKENPPRTDCVLYADYRAQQVDEDRWIVGSVHLIVCDREGDWVLVDFQNSHHEDFQSIAPKSKADCNRLAVKRLAGMLKR